jgi:hypothetical protein
MIRNEKKMKMNNERKGGGKLKKIFLSLFAIILAVGIGNFANATICDVTDVSGSVACKDGIGNNDSMDTLNNNLFFGFDDWVFLQKKEIPEGFTTTVDINLIVSPDSPSSSGTWAFDSVAWSFYEDLLIVLKDGVVVSNGRLFWFAYLLDDITKPISGTWAYPEGKTLSHLAVYGRIGTPVPEPATMLLLGTGLIGLAGLGRKKFFKKG